MVVCVLGLLLCCIILNTHVLKRATTPTLPYNCQHCESKFLHYIFLSMTFFTEHVTLILTWPRFKQRVFNELMS